MHRRIAFAALALVPTGLAATLSLTNFSNGSVADADDVNANFSALAAIANRQGGAKVEAAGTFTATGDVVASVTKAGTGLYDVTYAAGRFTGAPLVVATSLEDGRSVVVDAATKHDATGVRVKVVSLAERNRHTLNLPPLGVAAKTWTRAELLAAGMKETAPLVNTVTIGGSNGYNVRVNFLASTFAAAPMVMPFAYVDTNGDAYSVTQANVSATGFDLFLYDDTVGGGTNQAYGSRNVTVQITRSDAQGNDPPAVDGAFNLVVLGR